MKYESQYKSVFHKPVRRLDDKTEMQTHIVFPVLIHGIADIWLPSAVLFMVIEAVVDFLRDKLYY